MVLNLGVVDEEVQARVVETASEAVFPLLHPFHLVESASRWAAQARCLPPEALPHAGPSSPVCMRVDSSRQRGLVFSISFVRRARHEQFCASPSKIRLATMRCPQVVGVHPVVVDHPVGLGVGVEQIDEETVFLPGHRGDPPVVSP